MTTETREQAAPRHRHEFTAFWDHFGPYSTRGDVHYHPCFTEGCYRVVIGQGRDCGGPTTPHHRETLR